MVITKQILLDLMMIENYKRIFPLFGIGISYKAHHLAEIYANISQNYRGINYTDLRITNPNVRVDPNITG
jgi:Fe(3+) dicitrate transport protein